MQLIERKNWDHNLMCHNLYCSNDITHFEYIKINGMEIVVCLCERCSKKWEEAKWNTN